jgi:Xaa-Pro aminopeptidase
MATMIEKGASLEVSEAFGKLQDRFQKYGKLENEIFDSELRAKAAKMLEAEIHAGALDLVRALAGAEAAAQAAQAATTPVKKVWSQEEVRQLRLSGKLTDELMAEIKQATAEGRVI